MLGKDYMLAIIIVNYDDNIWNDQNLEPDSDLPPGWRTIRDSTGTYYWHVPTGTTQWHHPSCSSDGDQTAVSGFATTGYEGFHPDGSRQSRGRQIESPMASITNRSSLPWQEEDYFQTNSDPDSKCFAVRSLGWVEIPEEDLAPGKSSIAVNNCIQQLSHSKCEGRDAVGAWGEGQDMVMILKKDTLSLVDPVDHSLIHCQPIINIRVWGVGCNNGRDRDFAFVASDKDTCMLKCHVFRCDVPAKAIATALHDMCSKIMAERASMHPSMTRSLTMESISPEDLPLQVDFLDAVRLSVQKFQVLYIGHQPVPRAMGMEVLNRAIENVTNSVDRDEWEPITIHVSDTLLSLWKGEDGDDPFWECQVRYLTFLGVGHDTHTFAVIMDAGRQRFECHVFWCEPDAGSVSEAVQAACMVQYQKCLVAQTPPLKSKMSRASTKVKRATSMDSSSFAPRRRGNSPPKFGASSMKKGVLAFFETLRNKQSAVPMP
nr:PREDICTED: amyloid beta A4 precursor protein-binding family B member 3 isoform X1 [Lepisosteus oculatus]XP_015205311.1 PREDICTED: amyloid beta A4 precursor protein-binding family B member 3 isoform X1 [Lepisosteus oculatus]